MRLDAMMIFHVIFKESTTCLYCAWPVASLTGALSDVSRVVDSANVLPCQRPRMKKDLRGTHGRQAVPAGQGELVIIVGVGGDFVSALGVLRVGQE